jgi:hypothetical protein
MTKHLPYIMGDLRVQMPPNSGADRPARESVVRRANRSAALVCAAVPDTGAAAGRLGAL